MSALITPISDPAGAVSCQKWADVFGTAAAGDGPCTDERFALGEPTAPVEVTVQWMRARGRRMGLAVITTLMTLLGVASVTLWSAAPAWAQVPPITPSTDGMPGQSLMTKFGPWVVAVGLFACVIAVVYGGASWKGWGSSSSGRTVEGKAWVIAGLVGAAAIGVAVPAVNLMYAAGQGG